MKVEAFIHKQQEVEITPLELSLLTTDEFNWYKSRIPKLNNQMWWLKDKSDNCFNRAVAFVNLANCALLDGYYVADSLAVRPVLRFSGDLETGTTFTLFNIDFKVIDTGMAISIDSITNHRFDLQNNNYEESELKQYLDNILGEIPN